MIKRAFDATSKFLEKNRKKFLTIFAVQWTCVSAYEFANSRVIEGSIALFFAIIYALLSTVPTVEQKK